MKKLCWLIQVGHLRDYPWLKRDFGYEVIAMAADIGQGELEHLEEKA